MRFDYTFCRCAHLHRARHFLNTIRLLECLKSDRRLLRTSAASEIFWKHRRNHKRNFRTRGRKRKKIILEHLRYADETMLPAAP